MKLPGKTRPLLAALLAVLLIVLVCSRFSTGFWNPMTAYRAGEIFRKAYPAIAHAQLVAMQKLQSQRKNMRVTELTDDVTSSYEERVLELLRVHPGGVIEARFVAWPGVRSGTVRMHPVFTETDPPRILAWRCVSLDMPEFHHYLASCTPYDDS